MLTTKDILFIIVVLILLFIIGYLLKKNHDKRRQDIVKVSIKKDMLPADGQGNGWVQGGDCFMSDGTTGRVDGKYCTQTIVL